MTRGVIALCLIALVVAGCSEKNPTTGLKSSGIRFEGRHQSDTIEALVPMTVQVAGLDGAPAARRIVRLSAGQSTMGFNDPRVPGIVQDMVDTTDAQGRVAITVWFGYDLGPESLVAEVPALNLTDTARFTVLIGHLAGLAASPTDTAMYVGASVTLKTIAIDRRGDPRSDPVTYHVASGPITLSGKTITATGLGRAAIIATASPYVDTTFVTVAPPGIIAALNYPGGDTEDQLAITVFNSDGSNWQALRPPLYILAPRWAPSGTHLVFDNVQGGVYTIDPSGNVTLVDNHADHFPTYSRDGTWIYYSRYTDSGSVLWRVHPDGTSGDSLATTTPDYDLSPSPSPDGSELAYITRHPADTLLRVLTIGTGAVRTLTSGAWSPVWSPTGNQIAYISHGQIESEAPGGFPCGPINIINSDGSGVRQLTAQRYCQSFDWSPDGQWLIATNDNARLNLIQVSTGLTLPLIYGGYSNYYWSPTWKPTP